MSTPSSTLVSDGVRAEIAADPAIGAGNFLQWAVRTSPAPDQPILFLEKPLQCFWGEQFTQLSISDLDRLARIYASRYAALGVRAHDPVAVYLDDGIAYLVHYLALTRIGAIAVLTNGRLDPDVARKHVRHVGVVGIYTDAAHLPGIGPHTTEDAPGFVLTEQDFAGEPLRELTAMRRHRHDADDPVMIAHSSGTTGTPKAVLLQHGRFFHGVRHRLTQARMPGADSLLSSLPHSHNGAMAYLMVALLSGTPVYIASDHSGASVLRRISEFRPSMVVSFPQTYVEMTECDLHAHDLSSVGTWFNTGDAAHESHIRALIRHGSHLRDGVRQPGSVFIDGLGSSEMGFSLFRHVHTPQTNHYNRCVGRPLEWVDAQVLAEDGGVLGPYAIGRLGVKAPSVTSGYWNDSLLTYRSRLAGYFLTGDLAYKDEDGCFFHVDRVPDVIASARGPIYGLRTEEFLLARFGGLADCSVIAAPDPDSGVAHAAAHVRLRPGAALRYVGANGLLRLFNEALVDAGLTVLDHVVVAATSAIPLGSTGKVLKRVLRDAAADAAIGRSAKG